MLFVFSVVLRGVHGAAAGVHAAGGASGAAEPAPQHAAAALSARLSVRPGRQAPLSGYAAVPRECADTADSRSSHFAT